MNKILVIVLALMCISVNAAPNLDYLTESQCRNCHGNTATIHHVYPDCLSCHTLPSVDGWQDCNNCHTNSDHHDDAAGRCANCHDDRQKGK